MSYRWNQGHVASARSHGKTLFSRAIRKYGSTDEIWLHTILEEVETHEEAVEAEQFFIAYFQTKSPNGYNMTFGGEGVKGFKFTDEQRERHRISMNTPEARKRNSEAQIKVWQGASGLEKRKKRSEITRSYMSNAEMRKRVQIATKDAMHRPEVRKKIEAYLQDPLEREKRRERVKSSWCDENSRKNHKIGWEKSTKVKRHAVEQRKKDTNELIRTFRSVSEASRETGVHKSSILSCLGEKIKQAGGYRWFYVNPDVKR